MVWYLAFFLVVPPVLSSQVEQLTVEQAIDLALKNNGNMKIANLAIQQSQSRVREVKASRFPSLLLHSHYLHTPEVGYNEAVTNGGEYGIQLTTSLPLYDGGARSMLIDQSINNEEQATINLRKNKHVITFTVRSIYYEILQTQEEIRIRREIVERLENYLSLLDQLRRGGMATESDVLKARVDLNNARIAVDVAQQALQKSTLLLKNAVGAPFEKSIEFVSPNDTMNAFPLPTFSIENNADIQLLQHEKQSAEYEVSIAKAERSPLLTVSGDAGVLGVQPKEFNDDRGYSILLSLDLPLFDWGTIGNRIEQKELARDQLDMQLELQRREIETEWRTTLSDIEVMQKNLASYAQNITEAEQNYLSAKSRFAGGAGSNLEVLDAQRLLGEAKLNYNTTLFLLRLDRATVHRLSGD